MFEIGKKYRRNIGLIGQHYTFDSNYNFCHYDEYKEPQKGKRYYLVAIREEIIPKTLLSSGGLFYSFQTAEDRDNFASELKEIGDKIIAMGEVEWTEGDGLSYIRSCSEGQTEGSDNTTSCQVLPLRFDQAIR